MASEKSTNQNYLAILGKGDSTLYDAADAMGGLEPEGVAMVLGVIRACCIMGPEGTDPERCVVLVASYPDREAWALVDYREAIPDNKLEERMRALRDKLDPQVRDQVRVQSTQDHEFRKEA